MKRVGSGAIVNQAASLPSPAPQNQRSDRSSEGRSIAVTFDDLPLAAVGDDYNPGQMADLEFVNRKLLGALTKHDVTALGLVNGWKLHISGEREARTQLMKEWLVAGMQLGNHTYSHLHLSSVSLSEYKDDFLRGDAVLRALLFSGSKQPLYFRHPALDQGADVNTKMRFRDFIWNSRYQIAPVTVENADYRFNDVLGWALKYKEIGMANMVRDLYLSYTRDKLVYAEAASLAKFDREIPQVLLLHANWLNSEMLEDLLLMLLKRGYRFVALDAALSDPAYKTITETGFLLRDSYLCWEEEFRPSELNALPAEAPKPPSWITARFRTIRGASSRGEESVARKL